ncbi:serine hydrolase [Maribacter sp. 2-571]|uniref:serine hydrolase n=1 Tax=Maribacter sp. 2-571 TaxID=3417569 RepID=UPI003D332DF8
MTGLMHIATKKAVCSSIIVILVIVISGFIAETEPQSKQEEKFTSELLELKDYFKIPGLAVSIDKEGKNVYRRFFGVSDMENGTNLDSTNLFPIASITKVFSGVLVMKLVEQKKLSLDAPVDEILQKPIFGDSILVKHILSHTSQGRVGEKFYYSSRFGFLTNIIERATGKSFSEVMDEEILMPLQLKNTFLLKDSTQTKKLAKPYIVENGIESGFIDYGYSSSAGIVSNLEDLRIFNNALDNNLIINEKSKMLMFRAYNSLPYGYGVFNQQFQNLNMIWAYGQYDCYSGLLLKVPSENLTLTILANNNLPSDSARLINGDVTSSLFAISFIKNYLLGLTEMPLFEKSDAISETTSNEDFFRRKLLGQALAESYMARFDQKKLKSSIRLLNYVFSKYPDYLQYSDLNLLHNLTFLKDVIFHMELDAFNDFDIYIERIAQKLLEEAPNNPYVHAYLGTFYSRKGHIAKARKHFEDIVNSKNFSENWYTHEAEQWLKENE